MKTILAFIFVAAMTICGAAEPKWLYPWQKTLADYLKTINKTDVETTPKPVDGSKFKPGSETRNMYLVTGYTPLLPFVAAAVKLPADDFLWKNMWRSDEELFQGFLQDKHHELKKGQFWIPAHPTTANLLAWAYSNNAGWNPYYKDKAVATRAAVISINDLICWTENDYYYHDKRSSKPGRKYGLHTAIAGFSLTFNAFTMLKVKDILPAKVKQAWSTGLLHMCERINQNSPIGPINMRFSIPNGMYYAWLATGDPRIKALYARWLGLTVFGPELSPAGHHWEGKNRAPDGSYNGIALHRLAELYSITHDKNIINLLRHGYRLKNYLSLPMPDGKWLSPSHFNDRCQSGFANDQYSGRETHFVCDVPESVVFLRKFRKTVKAKPVSTYAASSVQPSGRVRKAFPWGGGKGRNGRMHDWGMVLHLPDYIYHQDESKIQQVLAEKYALPVLTEDNFTENFNNEFYCVRRPAYYAIFYTGSAVEMDTGATNYCNMLQKKGGYLNGFAGGGLSALWTPAGIFLIGRMTAYEAYDAKEVKTKHRSIYTPGWRDWANNHIVGKTSKGKILTSARTAWPESSLQDNTLTITGKMHRKLPRQKVITEANISYKRIYKFKDQSFSSKLILTTDKTESFEELYETIPMHITDDLKVLFDGKESMDEKISGVKEITLKRKDGSLDIIFSEPQTIVQKAKKIKSRQHSVAFCRNLQVDLPKKLEPGKPVIIEYELVPHTATGKGMQMVPGAIKIPAPPLIEVPENWTMAHYDAAQGVETSDKKEVVKWRDISGNRHDLIPFKDQTVKSAILKKDNLPAVEFNGSCALYAQLKPEPCTEMMFLAVVKVPSAEMKTKQSKNNRIMVTVGKSGADYSHGLTLSTNHLKGDKIEITDSAKYFRRNPIEPTLIGVGRMFLIKKGQPALYSFGLKGDIMEMFVFKPALPDGYLKLLKLKLKKKYDI